MTLLSQVSTVTDGSNIPETVRPTVELDFRTDRGQTVLIIDARWPQGIFPGVTSSARSAMIEVPVSLEDEGYIDIHNDFEPEALVTRIGRETKEAEKLTDGMRHSLFEAVLDKVRDIGRTIDPSQLRDSLDPARYASSREVHGDDFLRFRSPLADVSTYAFGRE